MPEPKEKTITDALNTLTGGKGRRAIATQEQAKKDKEVLDAFITGKRKPDYMRAPAPKAAPKALDVLIGEQRNRF